MTIFHGTAVIVGCHIGKNEAFTGPGRCQIEQEPFLEGTKPASRSENDAEIGQTAPFLITEQASSLLCCGKMPSLTPHKKTTGACIVYPRSTEVRVTCPKSAG